MIFGIDISSHQPVIDFQKVKKDGYSFVVIKVTGGDSYINDKFWQQYNGARAAGLAVGIYHYDGEPTVHTGTADAEAHHFLTHLPSPLPMDVFLAYDIEERQTRDIARYRRFCDLVQHATGKVPYLYTFQSFITELPSQEWLPMVSNPLWYAWYPLTLPGDGHPASLGGLRKPSTPAPFNDFKAWQYSGGTEVDGIPNATDANVYLGSIEELTMSAQPQEPTNRSVRGYINALGEAVLEINFGGNAVRVLGVNVQDAGITVQNATDEVYDDSVQRNEFQPWVKRGTVPHTVDVQMLSTVEEVSQPFVEGRRRE
jgi:GH25 family lysozyme M1 (1,4-beta-N-acetylmuramidase)